MLLVTWWISFIEEGEEGPALYRHLVSQLNDLGLTYLHVMHQGNEELLADIRAVWSRTIILNRPGRPREAVGSDVEAGLLISKPMRKWFCPTLTSWLD